MQSREKELEEESERERILYEHRRRRCRHSFRRRRRRRRRRRATIRRNERWRRDYTLVIPWNEKEKKVEEKRKNREERWLCTRVGRERI